ncbi:restriction endonuclease subunit S, partial [Halomonas sp. FME65]|uniref:restriction endonuclease subunit S n=1 Tax=Halomonas sp. FME65 TaxID=2742614 RepID=UPI001D02EA77
LLVFMRKSVWAISGRGCRCRFMGAYEYKAITKGFNLEKNDVLLTVVGSLGRSALFEGEKVAFQRSVAFLKPDKKNISSRFLYHAIRHEAFQQQLLKSSNATAQAGIYLGELAKCLIPNIKAKEQDLIVKILDTLDTQLRQTEAIIAKLQQVKQGLLQDLLTRGIDASGKLRPPWEKAPELYKDSPLGWIPKEWEWNSLASKVEFPTGQVDPRIFPYREWILVAPDHIESKTGRLLNKCDATSQSAISGKYIFQPGDVIYSKIRPYLRKAVLANFQGLCSADAYPLRPLTGIVPEYLLAVILGEHFSRFAESVSMRSGFPKINRAEMSEFSTAWPQAEEQEKIASIIKDSNEKLAMEERLLEKLKKQKIGLMDDLLTGRVRVTNLIGQQRAS